MTLRRTLLISMLVALAACAAIGIMAVFVSGSDGLWRLLGTAIDTAVATGLLLPLTFLTSREKLRAGGLMGMGVVLVCWACMVALMWLPRGWGYRYEEKILVTVMFTALMGLPSAGALLVKSLRRARWRRSRLWAGRWWRICCASWTSC